MFRPRVSALGRQTRCFSSQWKQQRDADIYANRAIREGLRSRAAYKLEDINKRFGNFLRQGASVVDLGAAPGGFSMIAARKIYINVARNLWNSVQRMGDEQVPREIVRGIGGSQVRRNFGQLICVDLQDMEPIPGAIFVRGDLNLEKTQRAILYALHGKEADVVLCDMAPATTGQKEQDHLQIMQLADEALHVAHKILRNGGTFCCKIFSGAEETDFRKDLESSFVKVKAVKPAASRKFSKEIYYVAQGYVPSHMSVEDLGMKEELYTQIKASSD